MLLDLLVADNGDRGRHESRDRLAVEVRLRCTDRGNAVLRTNRADFRETLDQHLAGFLVHESTMGEARSFVQRKIG